MSTSNRTSRLFALAAALLLTVMGTPPAAAQTMEEARAAYARGDHATALRGFRIHAERGDAEAQFILGIMYDDGEGVPQDYAEAVRWYRRAAEQDNADAQFKLGVGYDNGYGVPQDLVQAHKWYNLAASRAPNAGADSTRDRIANLQRALRRLGYDPGPVDAIPGARTRAAIRAFQTDAGLPVNGRISERLESAVPAAIVAAEQAHAPAPEPTHRPLELESTGSGFRVSGQGHVLTNAHVVRGCTEVRIPPSGVVEVLAREGSSGLALLQTPAGTARAVTKFRQGRGIRPGASVLVVGYPLRGLLASEANVSTGAVSALAGPGDDRRLIQITAPVQSGNSGGPVLDAAGNVVGVVSA